MILEALLASAVVGVASFYSGRKTRGNKRPDSLAQYSTDECQVIPYSNPYKTGNGGWSCPHCGKLWVKNKDTAPRHCLCANYPWPHFHLACSTGDPEEPIKSGCGGMMVMLTKSAKP